MRQTKRFADISCEYIGFSGFYLKIKHLFSFTVYPETKLGVEMIVKSCTFMLLTVIIYVRFNNLTYFIIQLSICNKLPEICANWPNYHLMWMNCAD